MKRSPAIRRTEAGIVLCSQCRAELKVSNQKNYHEVRGWKQLNRPIQMEQFGTRTLCEECFDRMKNKPWEQPPLF